MGRLARGNFVRLRPADGLPEIDPRSLFVDCRGWLIPEIASIFKQWAKAELSAVLEKLGLPYAPVNTPGDLFATCFTALGLDPAKKNVSPAGRPIALAEGKPVKALLAN